MKTINKKAIIAILLASTMMISGYKPKIKPKHYYKKSTMKIVKLQPLEYKHELFKCNEIVKPKYSQQELDLLSRVIYAEAGDESNLAQLLVGNVILNRIESKEFPSTMYGVIYQRHPLQYECTVNGAIDKQPSARAIRNAKRLLEGLRVCPKNVLYQSESKLGRLYMKVDHEYFCYG